MHHRPTWKAGAGLFFLGAALLLLAGCGSEAAGPAPTAPSSAAAPAAATAEVTCAYPSDGTKAAKVVDAPPVAQPRTGTATATVDFGTGPLEITLDRAQTPCTVGSFVHLAQAGYYDDTPCHRLTSGTLAVLQCGDPSGTGRGTPGYFYKDETSPDMTYPAGTVAMANRGANTNGSQFFLVYADSSLPPNYTVFGHISDSGMAVLTAIAAQGIAGGGNDGAPKNPVTIRGISIAVTD